jgi:hypothetical protein
MEKTESYLKHKKYFSSYKPNDLFWGIGIENETYIEIPNDEKVYGSFFLINQCRERYSVNYYDGYLNDYFQKAIEDLYKKEDLYSIPLLINAHAFTKCDLSGEHKTLYTKTQEPNSKFSGKTLFDTIKEKNSYFEKEYENSFCFDGDTIEFMTLNFYKTTVNKVIDELIYEKKQFINNLNALKLPIFKNKIIDYPKQNHGFAKFTTNSDNLAIFNNGTYHFNFTLPTQLNDKSEISDMNKFIQDHRSAIRCIQFFEPFFIAIYGSPDPLSKSEKYKYRFPKGSQRVAASRYISVGTYNTNTMITGKLLQENRESLLKTTPPYYWYKLLYKQINYKMNDKIGFDINFNKFLNHGIELRFFEWFDESLLNEVMEALVFILDFSVESRLLSQTSSKVWNNLMYRAVLNGKNIYLSLDELQYLRSTLKLNIYSYSLKIEDIFKEIISELRNRYNYNGPCSKYMLEPPLFKIINSFCMPTSCFSYKAKQQLQ